MANRQKPEAPCVHEWIFQYTCVMVCVYHHVYKCSKCGEIRRTAQAPEELQHDHFVGS